MGNLNIAILSCDTLRFMGVKSLLRDIPSVVVSRVADVTELTADNPDRFDVFVVDAETCISHIDFFIPRRNKTVVFSNTEPDSQSSFYQINSHWSVDRLSGKIADFIDRLHSTGTQQSELSQREIDVLKLVASGKINKEIADILQISINTVLTHRKNISAKLGIKSVSGLSVYAMMNGYITNV